MALNQHERRVFIAALTEFISMAANSSATATWLASLSILRWFAKLPLMLPARTPFHSLLVFALGMGLPSPNICRGLSPTRIGETNSTDSGSFPSGESAESPWPRFEIPAVPFTSSESQSVIFMSYWVQIWLPRVFFALQMCEDGQDRNTHREKSARWDFHP